MSFGEGSLGSSDVEWLAVCREQDADETVCAGHAADGVDGDCLGCVLEVAESEAAGEFFCGDEDVHGGLAGAEEGTRVGVDGQADDRGEGVGRKLVVGAGIVAHRIGGLLGQFVDETRTTAAW